MTARRCVRDRWIDEVLRTDTVGLSCKLVLIALSRDMTEGGRADASRETLAARVGLQSLTRVSDRLAEARKAELLDRVGGGYAGQPTIWQAMIPRRKVPRDGEPSTREGYGWRGTSHGVPFPIPLPVQEGEKLPRRGVAMTRAGACVQYRTRGTRPTPRPSRGPGLGVLTASAATTSERHLTLVVADRPSVPTTAPQPTARAA